MHIFTLPRTLLRSQGQYILKPWEKKKEKKKTYSVPVSCREPFSSKLVNSIIILSFFQIETFGDCWNKKETLCSFVRVLLVT